MSTTALNRIWLVGGVLGAVLLLAIGWFLFVGPQYSQANSLREQTRTTEAQLSTLRHRLAELRAQNANLATYQAAFTRYRQALPTTTAVSDFLRELQDAGDESGASVSGLSVGAPMLAGGAAGQVFKLPLTVAASGTTSRLKEFLVQIQEVQPRAVLIEHFGLSPQNNSLDGAATLTLSVQVFVAPAPGAATPVVSGTTG